MCGICGTASEYDAASQAVLERMCAAMVHRGPDEDGFALRGGVGLGMRRLRVIDLDTGKQPIQNEDGRVTLVFNGEIYNYRPLRAELLAAGHTFYSQSDTEVIAHAYEEWGFDALKRLNGMFAFALWDDNRRKLWLARDRTGQKPLFYWHADDGDLVFASDIGPLLASGQVPRQINNDAVYHYLSTQYVPGPTTILQNVHQVPPGHAVLWEGGTLRQMQYWSPSYRDKLTAPDHEWIQQTRQTVTEAVERHLVSDVPIGAYLSGGVDSSIVVGLMSQLASGRVQTFSIGFDVAAYSETDHARRIAERFNTDHHEFIVSGEQVTDVLPQVVAHAGQPLADTSLMATYLLAQYTRQHVTVALTGDGGDEAFAGYTRYTLDRLLRYYRLVPPFIRNSWVPALAGLLPENPDIPTDRNIVTGIRRLAQAAATTHKASILAWGSFFTEDQKRALATPAWLDCVRASETANWLAAIYDGAAAHTHLDRTLATDMQTYLAHDLLVKADRMAMAHSLETRAPFLDNEVLTLTSQMPDNLRLRGRTQKWVLRQAFADLLPPENVNRVKRGFGMPVASWLRGHMQGYAREILLDDQTLNRGMFRREAVAGLLDAHTSGREDHGQRIWALLVLELWLRQTMDGEGG